MESSKSEHLLPVDVIKGDRITRESISKQSVPGSFFRRGAESSGKVPNASAYIISCVVMYCAGLKGDCAASNSDSSSLPKKEGARFCSVPGSFFRRGRRKKVPGKGTHIRCLIVVDVAAIKVDGATIDEDSAALPNKEGARVW